MQLASRVQVANRVQLANWTDAFERSLCAICRATNGSAVADGELEW